MKLDSIESIDHDVLFELDENDTLWHKLSCGCRRNCNCCSCNENFRFTLYCVIIAVWQVFLATLTNYSTMTQLTCNIIESVFLLNIILDCNWFVLWQAIKTFKVYYTIINICISILAFNIDTNFFQQIHTYDDQGIIHLGCVISMIKNALFVLIVCIMDGYKIKSRLKVSICVFVLFHYFYFYLFRTFIDNESLNQMGKLFGRTFHWRTLAISTMSNGIAFIIVQLYLSVKYPSKFVLIPTFIPFEFVNNVPTTSTSDQNNNYNSNIVIKINKQRSVLNILIEGCGCHYRDGGLAKICCNRIYGVVSSKYMIFTCMIIWVAASIENYFVFGPFLASVWGVFFQLIAISIIILNMNITVIIHTLKQFTFWWKIQDTVIYVIALFFCFWSDFFFAVEMFVFVTGYVFMICNIRGLFVPTSNKCVQYLISHGLVMFAVIHTCVWALKWYLIAPDKDIVLWTKRSQTGMGSGVLDAATIMVERKLDLAIFFALQLFSMIRNPNYGIEITGCVDRIWKNNHTCVHVSKDTTSSIELNIQLLQSVPDHDT